MSDVSQAYMMLVVGSLALVSMLMFIVSLIQNKPKAWSLCAFLLFSMVVISCQYTHDELPFFRRKSNMDIQERQVKPSPNPFEEHPIYYGL